MVKEFKVEGIHCQNCVKRLDKAFAAISAKVTVSEDMKTVSIAAEADLPESQLREIIEDLGFDVK